MRSERRILLYLCISQHAHTCAGGFCVRPGATRVALCQRSWRRTRCASVSGAVRRHTAWCEWTNRKLSARMGARMGARMAPAWVLRAASCLATASAAMPEVAEHPFHQLAGKADSTILQKLRPRRGTRQRRVSLSRQTSSWAAHLCNLPQEVRHDRNLACLRPRYARTSARSAFEFSIN